MASAASSKANVRDTVTLPIIAPTPTEKNTTNAISTGGAVEGNNPALTSTATTNATAPAAAAAPTTPTTMGATQTNRATRRWNNTSLSNMSFGEPIAEFLGTMVLVLFGTAANAQGVLFDNANVSSSPAGGWQSVAIGWAIGVSLGAWLASNVSQGHVNPAITITFATFRGFPWRKVPAYLLAQLLGGIAGAALTYANYHAAISLAEGGPHIRTVPGTASIFGTYAVSYLSNVSAFFDEFLGTFLLVTVLLVVKDARNGPAPPWLTPIALFLAMLGIGYAFGAQTGFAVNPARDLGPRILSAMAGYGREVFNFRNQYWLWAGVLAPMLGGLSAGAVYDLFVYGGKDSVLSRRFSAWRTPSDAGDSADEKADVREGDDQMSSNGTYAGTDPERYNMPKGSGMV